MSAEIEGLITHILNYEIGISLKVLIDHEYRGIVHSLEHLDEIVPKEVSTDPLALHVSNRTCLNPSVGIDENDSVLKSERRDRCEILLPSLIFVGQIVTMAEVGEMTPLKKRSQISDVSITPCEAISKKVVDVRSSIPFYIRNYVTFAGIVVRS